ncbi:MAG TPA: hypothetical protein PK033_15115 [Acetivibrio sp.]|jgi:hypothetical protein|uniref:hypothetical protein n=1 Tax=Acetivibrio saccincola TaxID=1677857 RepID=UPI00169CE6B6|nr:hypothetical protein [Acetivibrio saccincola]NLW28160.1 hypothetical protein [Acetivibrio saccincola]HQA59189.1 hypothetical protein [Acetivibrio sp.]
MFDVTVSQEQLNYAKKLVDEYNFGQRGYGDGNKREQLTGVIGQTVFADLIGEKRPDGSIGFDGGIDFFINDKKVDIKTMTRKVPVKDFYVHNFIGYQKNYEVDYYVFASYNTTNRVLTICGYIGKKEFFEKATYFPKGSKRTRSDGTFFTTFAPLYEIKQTDLLAANDLTSLLNGIV